MTASATPTVRNQEMASVGLVESAGVNSFADFIPSNFNDSQVTVEKEKEDFKNAFICHLIFYAFFCISIVLYILIDLGLGSFLKNKWNQFLGQEKTTVLAKTPVFA